MTTYNLSLIIFYRKKLLNSPTKQSQIWEDSPSFFSYRPQWVTSWPCEKAPATLQRSLRWSESVGYGRPPRSMGMRKERLPEKNAWWPWVFVAGHISGILLKGWCIYTWIVIFRWYNIIYTWIVIFEYLLCHVGRKMNIPPPWSRM